MTMMDSGCSDPDCDGEVSVDANGNPGFCEAVEVSCDDDFDNDGDDADCADSNCPSCAEEDCLTLGDEDGNGLADCDDGCSVSVDVNGVFGSCEAVEVSCEDNFDNDGDGDVDCVDSNCPACSTSEDCSVQGDEDGTDWPTVPILLCVLLPMMPLVTWVLVK